jgi:hypothetical protein
MAKNGKSGHRVASQFSPIIIMKIKLKEMRLVGHAALVVEKTYSRNVLVTNFDGRKPL